MSLDSWVQKMITDDAVYKRQQTAINPILQAFVGSGGAHNVKWAGYNLFATRDSDGEVAHWIWLDGAWVRQGKGSKGQRGPAKTALRAADEAIRAKRPRDAFDALFKAEVLHHSQKPEDPVEGRELMGKWHSFRGILGQRAAQGQRASSIHSIGFPRAWNNAAINNWLVEHGFTPPVKPVERGKTGKYAWARLYPVDAARYLYRTDNNPRRRGLVFRFRIPK